MSAGRPERALSKSPSNSAPDVNKFAPDFLAVITGLPDIHRSRLLARAAADAKLDALTLDDVREGAQFAGKLPMRSTWKADPAATYSEARLTRIQAQLDAHYDDQVQAWNAALKRHSRLKLVADRLRKLIGDMPTQFIEDAHLTTISEQALAKTANAKADDEWDKICESEHDRSRRDILATTALPDLAATAHTGLALAMEGARHDAILALEDLSPELRKRSCERWWRRQLQRRAADARQFWTAATQAAGKDAAYIDKYSLSCWQARQERARQFGEAFVILGTDGKTVSLAKVMQAARRGALARLYTMALGQEELAKRLGLVPIFITLTLPPEWHPNPSDGVCSWTPEHGPKDADAELQARWARIRALIWERHKIALIGLKVIEAHRDGCPHAHALLYVRPDDIEHIDQALQFVFPEPAQGRRIASKLVVIDQQRARASTYVMKYLMKAMNVRPDIAKENGDFARVLTEAQRLAPPDGEEEEEVDAQLEAHDQHRAWASERRIRRYSFLGLHGVQRIWQRLVTTEELPSDAPGTVVAAWNAIQERRWADALVELGALRVSILQEDEDRIPGRPRARLTYEEAETAYGEMVKRANGFTVEGTAWGMRLTRQDWEIVPAASVNKTGSSRPITVVDSCPRGAADAAPPASSEADPDELVYAADLERLIESRSGKQNWAEWCERMSQRVHRLRTDPPNDNSVDNSERLDAA